MLTGFVLWTFVITCAAQPGTGGSWLSGQSTDACPPNEDRTRCGRLCSCDEFLKDKCLANSCSPSPVCLCKPGLVRDTSGQCIPEAQCRASASSGPPMSSGQSDPSTPPCPAGEVFDQCGRICSCADFVAKKCSSKSCTGGQKLCYCPDGQARSSISGKCVPEAQCNDEKGTASPPANDRTFGEHVGRPDFGQCDPGEVEAKCGRVCKCSEFLASNMCREQCRSNNRRCFCQMNYVRDDRSDQCIPDYICRSGSLLPPPPAGPPFPPPVPNICDPISETLSTCGRSCRCSDFLQNGFCQQSCISRPGCFCSPGFVRADFSDDTCIHESKCRSFSPPIERCGKGELLGTCGRVCSCSDFLRNGVCQQGCSSTGQQACFCAPGFVQQDFSKQCVPEESCRPQRDPDCGINQLAGHCGYRCTCDFLAKNRGYCTAVCKRKRHTKQCFCKAGFALDRATGECYDARLCFREWEQICTFLPDAGSCKHGDSANFENRWYYDPSSGRCQKFLYSGCLGNDNNFASLSACDRFCGDRVRKTLASTFKHFGRREEFEKHIDDDDRSDYELRVGDDFD